MRLIRGLHNLKESHHGCVATIGNFDGVHLGHQAVFRQLRREIAVLSGKQVTLLVHPDIASTICDEERYEIDDLETRFDKQIAITARFDYHIEQFDIVGS